MSSDNLTNLTYSSLDKEDHKSSDTEFFDVGHQHRINIPKGKELKLSEVRDLYFNSIPIVKRII